MLGVCYYPEHWDENWWAEDACQMRELGIKYVRIAEFAWSRIEPSQGVYDWEWLDRAIEVLSAEGLKIVMGTPTAAAPKWLVDLYPDALPVFEDGRRRLHGSRRHASAASSRWRDESARITEQMAIRYGQHKAVVGWQIDNELGSDDTVLLYGPEDAAGFRNWLARKYQSPERLNRAWGNVFWSMEVNSFEEVIPPGGAVSETNPAARLDFWRYSSDSLAEYAALQTAILRKHSPGRFITHNFMGFFHNFDHYKLSQNLDFCSWDSYPLGKIEHFPLPLDERIRWYNTSQPDFSAFHHELYRGIVGDKFWIMEQQPGPVNWAHWNPAPKAGMVRLWTWEALAHGAEVVSYFRWRQLPYAQEQMHAGLTRPDRQLSPGGIEAARVAREIETVGALPPFEQAPVAIILDYEASWVTRIQPQGDDFDYKLLLHRWYEAARLAGVDVDVVAPGQSLEGYRLVLVPCLPIISDDALAAFEATDAHIMFGARSGSKTEHGAVPWELPPGRLQGLINVKVAEVSSLRPGVTLPVTGSGSGGGGGGGMKGIVTRWRELLETCLPADLAYEDGSPAMVTSGRISYLGAWLEPDLLRAVVKKALNHASVATTDIPDHVRLRNRGPLTFAFNYGPDEWQAPSDVKRFLLGGPIVAACDVACWER